MMVVDAATSSRGRSCLLAVTTTGGNSVWASRVFELMMQTNRTRPSQSRKQTERDRSVAFLPFQCNHFPQVQTLDLILQSLSMNPEPFRSLGLVPVFFF